MSVFKCKWIDDNTSMWTDDYDIYFNGSKQDRYTNGPFILTRQARQIFYVNNQSNDNF